MAETKRIPAAIACIEADPPYLAKLTARFWGKVAKSEGGCWEWTAGRLDDGYGAFSVPPVGNLGAHRVAYWLATGAWPGDLWVLHRCDNPGCVRPGHLFLGTHTDNMRDSARKGRRPHQIASEGYRATVAQVAAQASATRKARTHCRRGHLRTPETTRLDKQGNRTCLVCVRLHSPEYQRKWKAINRDAVNAKKREYRAKQKAAATA